MDINVWSPVCSKLKIKYAKHIVFESLQLALSSIAFPPTDKSAFITYIKVSLLGKDDY